MKRNEISLAGPIINYISNLYITVKEHKMSEGGDYIVIDKDLHISLIRTRVVNKLNKLNYKFSPKELNKMVQTIKNKGKCRLPRRD